MADAKTIAPDNSEFPASLTFEALRKAGMEHIASFSGKVWTDHNIHDPGITMLEALCYVLTDLGYRTSLPFSDLLARGNNPDTPDNNFFTPAQILGNNPLTLMDYRKLLIDINGVRNAWLEKAELVNQLTVPCGASAGTSMPVKLRGLYKVLIDPDNVYPSSFVKDTCGTAYFPADAMLKEVTARLNRHRNLCEDIFDITLLRDEPIRICTHIEIKQDADPETVQTEIFGRIQDFFSPAPRFYTLQELLDKGKTIEAIYEGRPFDTLTGVEQKNGFLDTAELDSLQQQKVIHVSDLYRIIMDITGVAGITRLSLTSGAYFQKTADSHTVKPKFTTGEEWRFELQPDHRPVLDLDGSQVIFYRNKLPLTIGNTQVKERFLHRVSDYHKTPKLPAELDIPIPTGTQPDLAQYTSVQYEFPQLYGIGQHQLPDKVAAARKAQVLQLQAYLFFYDRLLADYLMQLSRIRELFALYPTGGPMSSTYFPSLLDDIPQLEKLMRFRQQTPGTYTGKKLLYPVIHNGEDADVRAYYAAFSQREGIIQLFIAACRDNQIVTQVYINEAGCYEFMLYTDNKEICLKSLDSYDTVEKAHSAALDCLFMAVQEDCYNRINEWEEEQYSFDLVYNLAGYKAGLDALMETPEQYAGRKERLLNHLLARFSEDFTDYTLTMYALNGKKNDPESNINSKATFLAAYPDISANRARAFDYSQPVPALPVCGWQKRVARLMGISREPGTVLNNFDLIPVTDGWIFRCYLPGGVRLEDPAATPPYAAEALNTYTPVFESRITYASQEAAADAYQRLLELAKDDGYYVMHDCDADNVYGFSIQSAPQEQISIDARHPVTYASAEKRNDIQAWIREYFMQGGYYLHAVKAQEGYYFLFEDEKGKVLLKSITDFSSTIAAYTAGIDCLPYLQEEGRFSAVLREDTRDYVVQVSSREKVPLAQYPLPFARKTEADTMMAWLIAYFGSRKLVYKEDKLPLYNWQLWQHNTVIWEGAFLFKSPDQLSAARYQLLQSGAHQDNYRLMTTTSGKAGLEIITRSPATTADPATELLIARHIPLYEGETPARQAILDYTNGFEKLLQVIHDAIKEVVAAPYIFFDPTPAEPDRRILLTTTALFKSDLESLSQIEAIASAIRISSRLLVQQQTLDEKDCLYSVVLVDENNEILAQSPLVYTAGEAGQIRDTIIELVQSCRLGTERGSLTKGYIFEWRTTIGTPLFRSIPVWDTFETVAILLLDWLLSVTETDFKVNNAYGATNYSFTIQPPGKHVLARQETTCHSSEAVMLLIRQLLQDIALLTREYRSGILTPHHYYFQVKDDQAHTLLEEGRPYTDKTAVQIAFYQTVRRGMSRANYLLTHPEKCLYGFNLTDEEGGVLAVHPQVYITEEDRDHALQDVIAYLQVHGTALDTQFLPGAWGANWQWLPCLSAPAIALELLEEKAEEQEALAEMNEVIHLARQSANYEVDINQLQHTLFVKDPKTNKRVAVHPQRYQEQAAIERLQQRLIWWANYNLSDTAKAVNTGKIKITGNAYIPEKTAIPVRSAFRVWNRNDTIAHYLHHYPSPEQRETALLLLLKKYRDLPAYTTIDKGAGIIIQEGNKYRFCIRQRGAGEFLWQSIELYDSAADARKQFEEQYLHLLYLATQTQYYTSYEPGIEYLQLSDKKGKLVARYKLPTVNREAHDLARKVRQEAANMYPVFKKNKAYGFRLYDPLYQQYDWVSAQQFDTPETAWTQFECFLQLLSYAGHYCLVDKPENCRYEIVLSKVLLDSSASYPWNNPSAGVSPENEDSGNDGWEKVNTFLGLIEDEESAFYNYSEHQPACRYAFRVVDPQKYQQAIHPAFYNTPAQREINRLRLQSEVLCFKKLYAWIVNELQIPDDVLFTALPCLSGVETSQLWLSYQQLKAVSWEIVAPRAKAVSQVYDPERDPYYYYQLKYNSKVVWESVHRFTTECDLTTSGVSYIDLLELARAWDAYDYSPVPGCPCKFTLSLRDVDGSIVAVAPEWIDEADIASDRHTRMFNALLYPVTRDGELFMYNINEVTAKEVGQKITLTAVTIWESAQRYEQPKNAIDALAGVFRLLQQIDNYQRVENNTCGPFGIEITHPDFVLATHPVTYTTYAARTAAIKEVKAAINAEGLHVMEHILLRPRAMAPTEVQWQVKLDVSKVEGIISPFLIITARTFFSDQQGAFSKEAFLQAILPEVNSDDKNKRNKKAAKGKVPPLCKMYLVGSNKTGKREYKLTFVDKDQVVVADAVLYTILTQEDSAFMKALNDIIADAQLTDISSTMLENPVVSKTLHFCMDDADCEQWEVASAEEQEMAIDPYSFRMTVVVPGWPRRFRSQKFRQFFEYTMRKEAPAHLLLRIVWITPAQMKTYEAALRRWTNTQWDSSGCDATDAWAMLITTLQELRNAYPVVTTLYDQKGNEAIILDETRIE